MRIGDMLGLALSALRQQKTRTVLTTLGVVFGSLVLAGSLSVGLGVQQAIRSLTSEFLRQIELWPQAGGRSRRETEEKIEIPGNMSEARRERLRTAIAARRAKEKGEWSALTQEQIAELAALKHVQLAMPFAWQHGKAVFEGVSQEIDIGAARPNDVAWGKRLVAGKFFTSADEPVAVVSEALLYLWGVKDEAAVQGVVGKKVRLEFRQERAGLGLLVKLAQQFPQALENLQLTAEEKKAFKAVVTRPAETARVDVLEYTIVGVVRALREGEERQWWGTLQDGGVVLPYVTAKNLFFKVGDEFRPGMDHAVLVVDQEENVDGVLRSVHEMGFGAFAPVEEIRRQRLIYLLIFSGQACVAIIALIVAGLGIANTMLISVLERTREIGIMKAVGADNRHLQAIFLVEGAIIGCVGAVLGLLLAWAASFPADAWIQSLVSRSFTVQLKQSIFAFPWWLPPAVFCFAVSITVLAAVFPSRRAARVDPVTALRHE